MGVSEVSEVSEVAKAVPIASKICIKGIKTFALGAGLSAIGTSFYWKKKYSKRALIMQALGFLVRNVKIDIGESQESISIGPIGIKLDANRILGTTENQEEKKSEKKPEEAEKTKQKKKADVVIDDSDIEI